MQGSTASSSSIHPGHVDLHKSVGTHHGHLSPGWRSSHSARWSCLPTQQPQQQQVQQCKVCIPRFCSALPTPWCCKIAARPPTPTPPRPPAYQVGIVAVLHDGLVSQHSRHSSVQFSNVLRGELQGPLVKAVLVVLATPRCGGVNQGVGLNGTLPVRGRNKGPGEGRKGQQVLLGEQQQGWCVDGGSSSSDTEHFYICNGILHVFLGGKLGCTG